MSGFEEMHLEPAVGAVLESLGYAAGDAAIRDQAPTAARGHNLLLALPPCARYAAPALAGLVSAASRDGRAVLLLAPATTIAEWAEVALPLAEAAGLTALASELPTRASRLGREGSLRLLVTTPEGALTLMQRSALRLDDVGHLVIAWPELSRSDEPLAVLMQDLPQDAQRILVPLAAGPTHPLAERYARRAHTAGPLLNPAPPAPPVRGAIVPRDQRAAALASLLESEDPGRLAVWCADAASAASARAGLPARGDAISVSCGDVAPADLVVAWDLPDPPRLARLREAGEVILLVPPHATGYAATIAARLVPARLRGATEGAREEANRRRASVEQELARGGLEADVLLLAPLFERHDPCLVAAALHRLWQAVPPVAAAAPVPPASGAPAAPGRLWIGVGRKDGVGPNDVVAALTRDAGVAAGSIGRIEIRELFSLVEVPAAEAEEIARRLAGKTIRRRQVAARVDRGARAPRERRGRPTAS